MTIDEHVASTASDDDGWDETWDEEAKVVKIPKRARHFKRSKRFNRGPFAKHVKRAALASDAGYAAIQQAVLATTATTAQVGMPVVGPAHARVTDREGISRVVYVSVGYALVLREQGRTVYAKLAEWGDLSAMTRQQVLAQATVIRLTRAHENALLHADTERDGHWLDGWGAAMEMGEARALVNGSDGRNGNNPGQP